MAGVYVPGLDMPKPGMVLDVRVYSNGLVTVWDKKVGWIHHHAIPVPDHGDLIDRDALNIEMGRTVLPDSLGATLGFGAAKRRVDDAPVVIEGFGKGINVPSKTEG